MKAAVVLEAGKPPVYGDFQEPVAGDGETKVAVSAAALSHVTRARASGTHYSSAGDIPFIAGVLEMLLLKHFAISSSSMILTCFSNRTCFVVCSRHPFSEMGRCSMVQRGGYLCSH